MRVAVSVPYARAHESVLTNTVQLSWFRSN